MASVVNITLPNGDVQQHPAGITPHEIAEGISSGLARNALAARVNGQVVETNRPITEDATLGILTWADDDGKATFWHSSAHLLAEALEALYPGIKLGIGPPIKDGFYYDIDFGEYTINEDDFPAIEAKMQALAKSGEAFERIEISKAEALRYFEEKGDPYKLDLLQGLEDGQITLYKSGNFTDLCKGPHIPNSKAVKAVKLLSLAGAYWRGDAKNAQLTRIYGISFPKKTELDEYLERLAEAKKRDHRKLGKLLDMFSFHEEGPGFPFWHHNGSMVLNALQGYLRKLLIEEYDYEEIRTPLILNEDLWHRSGHYQNYQENMYFTEIDEQNFAVKPMNCPGSTLVFGNTQRSYRELPLRMFEFGQVHRHEMSGALMGLFRVRAFTQDDAHIYCLPEQIQDEVTTLIRLIFRVYRLFGFTDVDVFLSTKPAKAIGSAEIWERSEAALQTALQEAKIPFQLNPGDGAFYGPKIDFVVKDALQRAWQLGTIQLDFSMPERFGLEYKGADGNMHRPVMIHRAILGSFERFMGILIEHTAGHLPLWLAPVQARILPISEKQLPYARNLHKHMEARGIRTKVDARGERIGKMIRDAEIEKVPFAVVVGQQEADDHTATLRAHGGEEQKGLAWDALVRHLEAAIAGSYAPVVAESKPVLA